MFSHRSTGSFPKYEVFTSSMHSGYNFSKVVKHSLYDLDSCCFYRAIYKGTYKFSSGR